MPTDRWWSLPSGPERQAAKQQTHRAWPASVSRLAEGLLPSRYVQTCADDKEVWFLGRSGAKYPANTETPRLFKVFFRAAVQTEKVLEQRESQWTPSQNPR